MSYLPMEGTEVYRLACRLANEVYGLVLQWPNFAQETVGKQFIRSIDSIAANLVEGDARVSDPDSIRFFRYSRSSSREACHWIRQPHARDLLAENVTIDLLAGVESCGKMISGLIHHRQKGPTNPFAREDLAAYGTNTLPNDRMTQ
jgi:four helix bundle protein